MLTRRISGFLILLVVACVAQAGTSRDFAAHPAIAELDTPHDVYAIGDIHGDYSTMQKVLAGAKLIEAAGAPNEITWTGDNSVLICTGDILDKFDHTLDCIAAFRRLDQLATKAGGRVIVTMGNHEAEFLAGKHESRLGIRFTHELTKAGMDVAGVRDAKDAAGIGAFLRDLPIGARVNDSFFSHAGNTHGMSVAALRSKLEKDIAADGFAAPILQDPDSILEARMHPHPWWETAEGNALPRNLAALGVARIVVGHQPGEVKFADGTRRAADQMFADPAGRFVMIDIGMSQGVDHTPPALLRIHRATANGVEISRISADGVWQILFKR